MNFEVKSPRRATNTSWLVNLGSSRDERAGACFRAVDLAARAHGLSKAEILKQLIESELGEFLLEREEVDGDD